MPEATRFQRAYSPQHKEQRAADLLEAARTLASRDGVRAVTLTAIATQAGVHASAVRRYYASREEILLILTEEGYRDWSHAVTTLLDGPGATASAELAHTLTDTLAERPLFCDLLTHVTLNLEREVTYDRVRTFKTAAVGAMDDLARSITAASVLDRAQAWDLITAVIAMTAPLWQAAHPAETLTRLYAEEPAMAHVGVDFAPTLTRLLTALIAGMTASDT
ncbi:TetR family transcriptional regulator [Streptomyces sp. NPDC055037]